MGLHPSSTKALPRRTVPLPRGTARAACAPPAAAGGGSGHRRGARTQSSPSPAPCRRLPRAARALAAAGCPARSLAPAPAGRGPRRSSPLRLWVRPLMMLGRCWQRGCSPRPDPAGPTPRTASPPPAAARPAATPGPSPGAAPGPCTCPRPATCPTWQPPAAQTAGLSLARPVPGAAPAPPWIGKRPRRPRPAGPARPVGRRPAFGRLFPRPARRPRHCIRGRWVRRGATRWGWGLDARLTTGRLVGGPATATRHGARRRGPDPADPRRVRWRQPRPGTG